MSVTISSGSVSIEPRLVLGYSWSSLSGNRLHNVISAPSHSVTFRPAGLRSGTLSLFCLSIDDAVSLESMHRTGTLFTLTDSEMPGANMRYVLPEGGKIALELDPDTLIRWIVRIDYQEITA